MESALSDSIFLFFSLVLYFFLIISMWWYCLIILYCIYLFINTFKFVFIWLYLLFSTSLFWLNYVWLKCWVYSVIVLLKFPAFALSVKTICNLRCYHYYQYHLGESPPPSQVFHLSEKLNWSWWIDHWRAEE